MRTILVPRGFESPAAAIYPRFAKDLRFYEKKKSNKELSVLVCNSCAAFWKRCGGALPDDDPFRVDVGTVPDCIMQLPREKQLRLSVIRLKSCIFRKAGHKVCYPFISGSVHLQDADFAGMLGILYDESSTAMTPDDRQAMMCALDWLKLHNRHVRALCCVFEEAKDLPPDVGDPFVRASAADMQVDVANAPSNSQQRRVGEQRSGLLLDSESLPGESHDPQFDLGRIEVGVSSARSDAKDSKAAPVTYSDDDLEEKLFVCLYPCGRGGYHPTRFRRHPDQHMQPSHYVKSRLRSVCPNWRMHVEWAPFFFDWYEKRRLHDAQQAILKPSNSTKSGNPVTAKMLLTARREANCDVSRH
jgi:hypothetical protein